MVVMFSLWIKYIGETIPTQEVFHSRLWYFREPILLWGSGFELGPQHPLACRRRRVNRGPMS